MGYSARAGALVGAVLGACAIIACSLITPLDNMTEDGAGGALGDAADRDSVGSGGEEATPDMNAPGDGPGEEAAKDGPTDGPKDGAAEASCGDGKKLCGGSCVAIEDYHFGCGTTSCTPCNVPNATAKCQGNSCVVGLCNSTYADCNGIQTDGCEASTSNKVEHCGNCSTQCKFANAVAKCENSDCAIDKCSEDYSDCNSNEDDGCETHTAIDSKNCGSCGHNCGAGSCSAGQCGPFNVASASNPVTVVVDENWQPSGAVYWTSNAGAQDAGTGGGVYRMPFNAAAQKVCGGGGAWGLSVPGGYNNIIFTSSTEGWVRETSTSGTTSEVVSGLGEAYGVVAMLPRAYVAAKNAVYSVDYYFSDPDKITLASGQNARHIAIESVGPDYVIYWTDTGQGRLNKVPSDGGTVTALATGLTSPQGLVIEPPTVYWVEESGSLKSVSTSGGTSTVIASIPSCHAGWLAKDGNHFYVTCPQNNRVVKVSTSGEVTLLSSSEVNPSGIATANNGFVYWANNTSSGQIRGIAK